MSQCSAVRSQVLKCPWCREIHMPKCSHAEMFSCRKVTMMKCTCRNVSCRNVRFRNKLEPSIYKKVNIFVIAIMDEFFSALYLCGQLGNFNKNFFVRAQNWIKQMNLFKLKRKFKLGTIQILLQHKFGHFWTHPPSISAQMSNTVPHISKNGLFLNPVTQSS